MKNQWSGNPLASRDVGPLHLAHPVPVACVRMCRRKYGCDCAPATVSQSSLSRMSAAHLRLGPRTFPHLYLLSAARSRVKHEMVR